MRTSQQRSDGVDPSSASATRDGIRDFVGYGNRRTPTQWPGQARVAVCVVVNYEEGGERSVANGDPFDDVPTSWAPRRTPGSTDRDKRTESAMEYGSRAGVWRLLRILRRHDVPTTVFACARALERNPHVTRAFVEAGMDIANHGLWWEGHALLDAGVERARIEESTRLITALTGTRPVGWYSRDGVSPQSRRLLRDLGYLYDANAFNDDVPYELAVDGTRHLVLPYAGDANDARLTSMQRMATADAFAQFLDDAVRQLLMDTPRASVLPIGLHPRIIGRPAYALALERFLERNRDHDQLWFTTQRELALVWRSSAYPAATGTPAGDQGTTRTDDPTTGAD